MIARILKGLVILVVLVIVAIGALFAAARLHDGPLALIPGGPLAAGDLVTEPVADWSFATDVQEVELQLAYESSSRTTWILVKDGVAYIPASLSFPPGKRWHKHADQNGAAIVRVLGKRYPVTLVRVKDDELAKAIGQVVLGKYPIRQEQREGGAWFFKLEPRAGG